MKYKFDFDTQYNQFYIIDKLSDAKTDSDDFWTELAHKERLAVSDSSLIGIRTESYGHINGEMMILEKANEIVDTIKYDHIVEGGLNLKSGILQILDCPMNDLQLELKLHPGKYRIRIYSENLDSVLETDSYDDFDDHYKIEIWPDDDMDRKVLKIYSRK